MVLSPLEPLRAEEKKKEKRGRGSQSTVQGKIEEKIEEEREKRACGLGYAPRLEKIKEERVPLERRKQEADACGSY